MNFEPSEQGKAPLTRGFSVMVGGHCRGAAHLGLGPVLGRFFAGEAGSPASPRDFAQAVRPDSATVSFALCCTLDERSSPWLAPSSFTVSMAACDAACATSLPW